MFEFIINHTTLAFYSFATLVIGIVIVLNSWPGRAQREDYESLSDAHHNLMQAYDSFYMQDVSVAAADDHSAFKGRVVALGSAFVIIQDNKTGKLSMHDLDENGSAWELV